MKATTHTEVYRPFEGTLKERPMQAAVLAWSGVRVGFRRKLPALLLFAVPTILTIVTAFMIQVKFDAEKGALEEIVGTARSQAVGMMLSDRLGEVEGLVVTMIARIQFFVVLIMGWYGAGLIAEDRKMRANLLYFARPMTRGTYLWAKLGTVFFWGAMTVVVPTTILCSQATFQSPDWSFMTERWPTILMLEGYALVYVFVHAALVLAVSSACDRRNRALAGIFGIYLLTTLAAEAMTILFDGQSWRLLSIPRNFERINVALFGVDDGKTDWPLEASIWALGAYTVASFLVLGRQVRKLEIAA